MTNSVTWQAFAAIGDNWTPSITSTLGFRALYVEYMESVNRDGNIRNQQTILVPQLTVSYLF